MTNRAVRFIVFGAALVVPLGTTVSVAQASSVTVTATVPSTLPLSGTIHDFEHTQHVCSPSTAPINPDFEAYGNPVPTPGLIEPTLDAGGLPVFKTNGSPRQITDAGSFNEWYRDVPDGNMTVNSPLVVNRNAEAASPSGYRYTYNNLLFFPADGKGWDTPAACGETTPQEELGVDQTSHNFSFTDHVHSTFGYLPGETLDVGGDDDVWVFVNGHLAIDLGGLHPIADSGVYQLSDHASELGLVKGQTYSFDIFCAERHSQGSTFTLNTTMALEPTFGISNLGISATAPQPLGPGATDVAINDIPSASLPAAAVDEVAAAPLRSVPLRSVPLRSVPLRSVPLRSVPLDSAPLQRVLLSQVPLTGTTWQAVLAGSAYANAPLESVTLQQAFDAIAALPAQPVRLTLDQVDLSQTALRNMTVASIFLGDTGLGQLPIPSPTASTLPTDVAGAYNNWCAWLAQSGYDCNALGLTATSPVLAADLQGVPLRSVPLRSVPLRSVPASAPLRSVPLRSVDVANSPLRSVPLTALLTNSGASSKFALMPVATLPAEATVFNRPLTASDNLGIVTCTPPTAPCNTLGAAKAGNFLRPGLTVGTLATTLADAVGHPITLGELGQLPADFTIGDLADSVSSTYSLSLGDVLLAVMPPSGVPWESIPLGSLPLAEPQPNSPAVAYTVAVNLNGSAHTADGTLTVTLPPNFHYDGHVTGLTVDDAVHSDGAGHVTFSLNGRTVPSVVTITFHANPGLILGSNSSASVAADFHAFDLPHQTASANESDGAVTVTDAGEPSNNSVDTATPIAPDHLVLGAVSVPGDVDYYRLPAPPAGTHVHVLLSHLPTDDDLVVYGPTDAAAAPNAAPLRSVPLRSVPLLDSGIDATGASPPTPQLLNDVPLLTTRPVMGESAHHGTDDEEVDLQSTGGTGSFTIQVTGYNGASSNQPYLVRVVEDTPQTTSCPTLGLSSQSTLAGGLPPGDGTKKSLFLVNTQQLAAEFPGTSADVMTALNTFEARGDVAGLVVPVDADPVTVTAYNTWNADPCSAPAANSVVEAINAIVRGYKSGGEPITSVTLVGSDRQLPMYRAPDLTLSANENGYADSDSVVAGGDDPLSAAQRSGDMLTDDVYGSLNPVSWLGRRLYLPDLAVGRLVETPGEIKAQLQQFQDAGGALTPLTGLTTGYDFLADGAHAVDSALSTDVSGSHATLIDDPGASTPWRRSDLIATLFPSGQSPFLDSINAHFDHNRALPSSGNATSPAADLFTVNDVVAGKLLGRLLFSMGCHAGLNVPDGYVGGPATTAGSTPSRAQDWPQTFAAQKAIWVANTGFGLGDTAAVALSEELMRQFAQRLNGSVTAGQALQFAKLAYFGSLGAYGVYDEKAMEETVFYGLPMWRVGGPAYHAGDTLPTLNPAAPTDPPAAHVIKSDGIDTGFSGLTTAEITINPTFTRTSTSKGDVWSVGGETQVTHYRPIQPRTSVGVTRPDGQQAHGALITALASQDQVGVNPAFARPTVDLGANEPEASAPDMAFPAQFETLTKFATPGGDAQRLVMIPGQFFSSRTRTTGTQRLFTSMTSRVLFSPSENFIAPTVTNATSAFVGGGVTFSVDALPNNPDSVVRVIVLYHTAGTTAWQRLGLVHGAGQTWSGSASGVTEAVEWFAQAEDSSGNVGVTDSKGRLFGSQTGFRATVSGTVGDNGWFTGPVTIDAAGPARGYLVKLNSVQAGTGVPYTLQVDGSYAVSLVNVDSQADAHDVGTIKIDQAPPTAHFATPSPLVFKLGGDGSYTIACEDAASGVVDCPAGGTINTSVAGGGVVSFTIHDRAGNAASISLPYSVQTNFVGFTQPVNDPWTPATGSVFKYGSTIPLKFQLKNGAASPALISDALAQTIANQCAAKLLFVKTGSNSLPVDEAPYTDATDSGGCFRYDVTAHQFIYNLGTKTLPGGGAGQQWSLRALVTLNGGVIADHPVQVGLK